MSRRSLLLVLALLGTPLGARAADPEAASIPAAELKSKLMYVQTGLGRAHGNGIYQNGKRLPLGYFDENAGRYFADVPDALRAMDAARVQRIVGFSLTMAGVAVLLVDLAYMIRDLASTNQAAFNADSTLFVGLFAGGVALGLAGNLTMSAAHGSETEAVNKYNAAFLNAHLPDDQKIDFRLFSVRDAHGLSLAYRF